MGPRAGSRPQPTATPRAIAPVALAGLALAVLAGCGGGDPEPAAAPSPPAATSTTSAPSSAPAGPVSTDARVGVVAGELDPADRAAVKAAVTAVVDRYVDAAWVAGPWPREDFAAAFADFRPGVAAQAASRDLDLLTAHPAGATTSAVEATTRRLRIDVLAPRGRVGAATAHLALDLVATPTTPGAAPVTTRVRGSLFLTRRGDAWKVFGYDVREGAA